MILGPWVEEYGLEKATQMAQEAAAQFTRYWLSEAQKTYNAPSSTGDPKVQRYEIQKALFQFGMAIHTIMDAESPAHKPWQVYSLTGNVGYE